MEFRILPEPSPEEREAILAGLEDLHTEEARPAVYRSVWRAEGIRENLENAAEEDEIQGATARPRRSPVGDAAVVESRQPR